MGNDLSSLRQQINDIDANITDLLNKRAAIAKRVGAAKQGGAIYNPAREAQVIANVTARAGDMPAQSLDVIYRQIIAACRNIQQPLRVAYLGPPGTYSEQAAHDHCGETSVYLPAPTLDAALAMAQNGQANIAVLPIENSAQGAVARTLDLLTTTDLTVCGEVLLPIQHQLLSHAKNLKDIQQVAAHPQALAQCREWLKANVSHAKQVAASSNAQAAQMAAQQPYVAAIASQRAADLYDIPIAACSIQDTINNTTRFLVLGKTPAAPTGNDKTSLLCATPNTPGALHNALAVLAKQNINLVKLASRPSPNTLWDYLFYIDIDGHQNDAHIATALAGLRQHTILTKILGSYPKGN